jgi:hypothetical protein
MCNFVEVFFVLNRMEIEPAYLPLVFKFYQGKAAFCRDYVLDMEVGGKLEKCSIGSLKDFLP